MTKSVIFHPFLVVAGGSERITLEEERFLRQNNFDTTIITFEYKDVFDHAYQPQVKIIHSKNKSFIPNRNVSTWRRRNVFFITGLTDGTW